MYSIHPNVASRRRQQDGESGGNRDDLVSGGTRRRGRLHRRVRVQQQSRCGSGQGAFPYLTPLPMLIRAQSMGACARRLLLPATVFFTLATTTMTWRTVLMREFTLCLAVLTIRMADRHYRLDHPRRLCCLQLGMPAVEPGSALARRVAHVQQVGPLTGVWGLLTPQRYIIPASRPAGAVPPIRRRQQGVGASQVESDGSGSQGVSSHDGLRCRVHLGHSRREISPFLDRRRKC